MRAWRVLFRLCDEVMIFFFGEGFFLIRVKALLVGLSTGFYYSFNQYCLFFTTDI